MKRVYLFLLSALALAGCGGNENLFLGGGLGLSAPTQDRPSSQPQRPQPVIPVPPRNGTFPYEGVVEQAFRQRRHTDKVDLLFSIDHSGSMDKHIRKVVKNIAVFTDYLLRQRVDFQMGLLVNSDVAGDNNGDRGVRYGLVGPHPVVRAGDANVPGRVVDNLNAILAMPSGGYEIGVSILEKAVQFPVNQLLFRPDAAKAFLVLTDADDDENDESAVPHFLEFFDQFAGEFPWSMIGIGHPSGTTPKCEIEEPRQFLLEGLVSLSGGVMGDICDEDFSEILNRAAERVTKMLTEFSLARYSELAKAEILSIGVTVNGQSVPADPVNGYVWDPSALSISFRGSAVPPEGAEILVRVEYRVEG